MSDRLERLQAAGIAVKSPLEEPYRTIAGELSEEEVDALISVKRRFDASSDVQAHGRDGERPPDEFFAII